MSTNQNKDVQEIIKYLKSCKNRQACGATIAYATAVLMLTCTAGVVLTHDKEHFPTALLLGGIGTFNCYLGDKMYKRYDALKAFLNAYKKQQNQNQK